MGSPDLKYLKNIIRNIIKYPAFILLLAGCSGREITNPLMMNILKSKNAVTVSKETFETLKIEPGSYSYCGFDKIILTLEEGEIVPEFEKILYDPEDSVMYIKGVVYILLHEHINGEPVTIKRACENAQIIIGNVVKLPETYQDEGKLNIHYNYLVGKNGEFSLAVKVHKHRQIVIAPREEYEENGEYDYTPLYTEYIYEIFRLNNIKSPNK
ncbi:MAG: hypothetical protein P4L45_10310 [Ignavibacteriaceae bacterium]|nr:hypothetical protein [Ignavibacteriaceae bacterium]